MNISKCHQLNHLVGKIIVEEDEKVVSGELNECCAMRRCSPQRGSERPRRTPQTFVVSHEEREMEGEASAAAMVVGRSANNPKNRSGRKTEGEACNKISAPYSTAQICLQEVA